MKPKRLLSLDVLRGFDMFFIMGGGALLIALSKWLPCGFTEALAGQMRHAEWDGFTCYDMIFPLFLFIAGISFPFSYSNKKFQGQPDGRICLDIVRRAAILIILGLVYNGFFKLDFPNLRIASVLGRIGIAWAVAAVLFVKTPRVARFITAGAILIGYWLLLLLVAAPDAPGADPFSFEGNLVGYIDRHILPGRLLSGTFDPEGILSTLPAIVTAMLGMFAGEIVYGKDTAAQGRRATMIMVVAGVALVCAGLLWDIAFPINKKLWSSSYVCFVGGLSFLLFSLFYFVIDVVGAKRGTLFLKVIGTNSITIYMAQKIVNFRFTSEFFTKGLVALVPENSQAFFASVFYIAICWLFLYFLYRKKIFLKV